MKPTTTIFAAIAVLFSFIFFRLDSDVYLYFSKAAGDFDGKVVWITGASSGIGASLARDLAGRGARVVISARRTEQLNEVAVSCTGKHKPLVIPFDVTDFEAQQSAFQKIMSSYGRIDSIVLNAGCFTFIHVLLILCIEI